MSETNRPRIVILGAGPGGLCIAKKLLDAGQDKLTILERGNEIGGTWVNNRYPGLACDVPSFLYSFSFEMKVDWTKTYAMQPEIKRYVQDCARKYGIDKYVRFDTDIISARWIEDSAVWRLTDRAGNVHEAEIFISALGMFNEVNWPRIDGLDSFQGEIIHTAHWPEGRDLSGRNVAVVGSAASAVQLIPEVARQAARLTVFQRTANWVMPKKDADYTEEDLEQFRRNPQIAHDARAEQRYQMEIRIAFDNKPIIADMERQSLRAQSVVTDAHTREKLRPNVPLGSQRPLYSNDYYPTFNLPHVRLITGAVTRVGERSVSTATETVEDVDTLILATGYKANKFLSVIDVYGRDGLSIHDAWSEGPQAYLGIATSGFPNLFMLYGPNTNNGSIMTMLEYQSDYIIARLRQMLDAGLSWVDIRKSVMDAYNEKLQAEIRAVEPWQAEGSKYYRAASGRIVTQWPHNMEAYEKAVAVDDFDLYEHSAKQGRLATA